MKTQLFDSTGPVAIITVLALLFLFYLNRLSIRHAWLTLKTRLCLGRLGLEQLSNVKCPDGLGNIFLIDRLLLRHDGISLLMYKRYPGKIFCADHIDQWTQMLGQKSYKFNNPLFELDHQVKAVSACVEDISVNGYLFFDHHADFPKGHPKRVVHPDSIPQELQRNNRHQVEPQVMAAWKKLQSLAVKNNKS